MSGLRGFGLAAAVLAASGGVALAAWKYLSAREQKLNSKQNSDSRESEEELPVELLNTSANLTTERLLIEEDNIASNQTVYTEKSRESAAEKQERVEEGTVSEKPFKQVLVLGLDGSGKTSVLHSIVTNRGKRNTEPTGGFNAMSITTHHSKMEFLEIGGSEQLRPYWKMYLPKALAVIYVVDSADHNRLPLAKMHLHQLIQQDSILPLVVLANKQDLHNAYHITEIHDALALSEVCKKRQLFLIGTHVTKDGSEVSSSIEDTRELLEHIVSEVSV